MNAIYHEKTHSSGIDEAAKAVTEIVKCEYPFYTMESTFCEMEDLEIMYVTSWLNFQAKPSSICNTDVYISSPQRHKTVGAKGIHEEKNYFQGDIAKERKSQST